MKHILTLMLVLFIQQPSAAQQLSSKNARSLKVLLSKLDKEKKSLGKKYAKKVAELNRERANELGEITEPIIEGLKALQKRVATEDLDQAAKIHDLIAEISAGENPEIAAEVQEEQATKPKQTGSPFVYLHTVDSKKRTQKLILFLPDGTFVGPERSGKWQRNEDKFIMSWDVPEKWVDTGTIGKDGFINGISKGGENVDWHLRFSVQDSAVGGVKKRASKKKNPTIVSAYLHERKDENEKVLDGGLCVFLSDGTLHTKYDGTGRWQLTGSKLNIRWNNGEIETFFIKKNGSYAGIGARGEWVSGSSRYDSDVPLKKIAVVSKELNIPRDAVVWNGHHYFVLTTKLAVNYAEEYAELLGGHLARIESPEEHNFIYELIKGQRSYYILDGKIGKKAGEWLWSDGRVMTYIAWHADKPSDNRMSKTLRIHGEKGMMHNRPRFSDAQSIIEWDQ